MNADEKSYEEQLATNRQIRQHVDAAVFAHLLRLLELEEAVIWELIDGFKFSVDDDNLKAVKQMQKMIAAWYAFTKASRKMQFAHWNYRDREEK